jgi:hypothetical protein
MVSWTTTTTMVYRSTVDRWLRRAVRSLDFSAGPAPGVDPRCDSSRRWWGSSLAMTLGGGVAEFG